MINEAGAALIRDAERCKLKAYLCPVGKLTVGYGHTGPDVRAGMTITKDEAERLFVQDVEVAERDVRAAITRPMNENELAAFTSLAFNIGGPKFASSTAARLFNSGNAKGAADAIEMWNKGKDPKTGQLITLGGLVTRRAREKLLFLTPVNGIHEAETPAMPQQVEETEKRSLMSSSTVQAATAGGALTGVSVAVQAYQAISSEDIRAAATATGIAWAPLALYALGGLAFLLILGMAWWKHRKAAA